MAGKRRRSTNYLNNASLLEEIAASKERWEEAKRGINDPDSLPSAAECMTPKLVKMLVMLVDRYSQKSNWRGYTYIDDMKSEAVLSLLNGALKFKPEVSQNPFGYLTQIVTHSFLTTLDKEKKVRLIRDDILEQHGFSPSHTRQLENEEKAMSRHRRMADEREGIPYVEPPPPIKKTKKKVAKKTAAKKTTKKS